MAKFQSEAEVGGIRGLFHRIMATVEWVFMIACVVGGFWLMTSLFGPGWFGKSIGLVIKMVRSTITEIGKAFTAKI